MSKRALLAAAAIFVAWSVLDFLIHGVLLANAYADTAELWRPMLEMKMGLVSVVTAVSALAFTIIYARFFAVRSLGHGALYGLLWGIAMGMGMGFGTYAVMPLPYSLALAWFLGTVVEAVVAGLIVGAVVRASEPVAA